MSSAGRSARRATVARQRAPVRIAGRPWRPGGCASAPGCCSGWAQPGLAKHALRAQVRVEIGQFTGFENCRRPGSACRSAAAGCRPARNDKAGNRYGIAETSIRAAGLPSAAGAGGQQQGLDEGSEQQAGKVDARPDTRAARGRSCSSRAGAAPGVISGAGRPTG